MLDYINPINKRKSDILLIHSSNNDLINNVNTMKKVRNLVKCVYDVDKNEEIQIGFLGIISRQDRKLENKINESKAKLSKYCEGKEFIFVDNNNINKSCLNNSKI